MELHAGLSASKRGLHIFADTCLVVHCTAVSVLVQDVIWGSWLGSRRSLEADRLHGAPSDWQSVWLREWLEPHESLVIVLHVLVEDLAVKRGEVPPISDSWNLEGDILERVAAKRFIQRIITDDIRVL